MHQKFYENKQGITKVFLTTDEKDKHRSNLLLCFGRCEINHYALKVHRFGYRKNKILSKKTRHCEARSNLTTAVL